MGSTAGGGELSGFRQKRTYRKVREENPQRSQRKDKNFFAFFALPWRPLRLRVFDLRFGARLRRNLPNRILYELQGNSPALPGLGFAVRVPEKIERDVEPVPNLVC
jgi:hypothetical protein